jgi:hypothetical protein
LYKSKGEAKAPPPGESTEQRRFDPLDLPQDEEVVPLKYPQSGDIHGKVDTAESESPFYESTSSYFVGLPDAIDTLNNQAFRVQIFTSKLYGEARQMMTIAEEIFDRIVFLDYEVPYFKVRVGNFALREEAEDYLPKVKTAGYTNAWLVLVNVAVKEPSLLYPEGTPPLFEDSVENQEDMVPDD